MSRSGVVISSSGRPSASASVWFCLDTVTVSKTAINPGLGNLVALLGGFSFALVVMGLRWLSRAAPPGRSLAPGALLAGNMIAVLVTLPLAWPIEGVEGSDWLLVTYLGVFQVGLTYVLLSRALHRLRAFEASLLLLIEPVLNPIWAWWAHGEVPGSLTLAGGGVIVLTTVIMTRVAMRAGGAGDQGVSSSGQ